MDLKLFVELSIVPALRLIAARIRRRDANTTGLDDEAAAALEYAVERLERWIAPEGLPADE